MLTLPEFSIKIASIYRELNRELTRLIAKKERDAEEVEEGSEEKWRLWFLVMLICH